MNENSIRPHYPQSISDGQHSIYIAELPIRLYQSRSGAAVQTVYRHILIAGFDEHGRQMWEMNGLATEAKTRQTKTFGAPFDSSDRIWFWQHIPTRFWTNAQNPVRLFNGNPKEISRLRLQAMEAGTKINEADLHYRAWLNPQNSNSVAATLLKAMGKDPKDVLLGMRELYENGTFSGGFPNYKGFGLDLLPGHVPSPTVDPAEVPIPVPRPVDTRLENVPMPKPRPENSDQQHIGGIGNDESGGHLREYQPSAADSSSAINEIFTDVLNREGEFTGSYDNNFRLPNVDMALLPDGVRGKLSGWFPSGENNKSIPLSAAAAMENAVVGYRTKNERMPVEPPILRPRPKLNPIKEGYLKDMPDDGRLILAAEMVGFNGRKEADKAETERMARFDVQRKMAQDLEDIKVGKVSTVWGRYGHPKAVRDLLGEEAYQTFVDDRLEAGIISNATAGLHLLQDAELFGIADGTTKPEAPHEKLAELMTPKVLAAAAERARDILDMRRTKPSEAVLLSSDLSNRKAQFDAAFDANEAVDAEEMDAFLFYHEAAQREIGIAEPAIEMIPPRWASQVAARFEATPVDNGTPTDLRAREAELKQHYDELQQSFGARTDDVIAYSLARINSNKAFSVGPVFQLGSDTNNRQGHQNQ